MANHQWVYGIHSVQALLERNPDQALCLWLQQGRHDNKVKTILALAEKNAIEIHWMDKNAFSQQIKGNHQGVAVQLQAVEEYDQQYLEQLVENLADPAFLLILDGVTDPHNLGACLRSADAAGVHGVIVPKHKSSGLNATVRKVACGAAEVIPLITVTNLARCLKWLRDQGVWLIGADGAADQSIYNMEFKGPIALVMGAEGQGMRRLTKESCDYLCQIPITGSVSSLNVSVATGICLFEARRQRLLCL